MKSKQCSHEGGGLRAPRRLLGDGVVVLAAVLCGCEMEDQPRYSPYQQSKVPGELATAISPIEGTVARESLTELGALREPPGRDELTGDGELLSRGRTNFTIYCSACHGPRGEGDGEVVKRGFPSPGSLRDRNDSPQHIFDVTYHGYKASPSYQGSLAATDAWGIAYYIRNEIERRREPQADGGS